MKVLSLGAGVQSTTLLLMACKGEIEKPDVAIFADTGWERQVTYNHLKWLKSEAEKHGIPVLIIQERNIRDDSLNAAELNKGFVFMPIFSVKGSHVSIGRRRCTETYKITPIQNKIRELLGVKKGQRFPFGAVEKWLGISLDEHQRMGLAYAKWIHNRYPLVERMMTRNDCILWLHNNYNGLQVAKSSCIGCPYHNNTDWQDVYHESDEWEDALLVDETIRVGKGGYTNYLHKTYKPLREVDLRTPEDRGQIPFEFYKQERITLFAKSNYLWTP
jgi:hypothetical protein